MKYVLLAVVMFILCGVVAVGLKQNSPASKQPKCELVSWDSCGGTITGLVKNISQSEVSYVAIKIRLKDKDGAQIGDTIDNTHNLEAGGVWKFSCPVTVKGCKTFELVELVAR